MNSNPSKRLRFGTTRSRTGCLTCRTKRIKCDEARPVCFRCRKGCRNCAWSQDEGRKPPGNGLTAPSSLSMLPETSSREKQALEYFASRTSQHLIGTWNPATWTSAIMQCAISEPSIQRVSIALGALHHVQESGTGDYRYALGQYVTALGMVRDNMARLADLKEVLLLACVLFCAFECMNYHIDSAMSHLGSGLNLMLHHLHTTNGRAAHHDRDLQAFLLPVLRLLDNDRLCLGALSSLSMDSTSFEVPDTFSSVHEVHKLLTSVLSLSHRQLVVVKEGQTPPDYLFALQKAQQWCKTFDKWLPPHIECASEDDVTNLLPILAWRGVIGAIMKADHTKGEMAWDELTSELVRVVECAELFLDLTAELVDENETFLHPLSYTKESTYERGQHTLTVERGGQITEGLLAKLLANGAALPSPNPTAHSAPSEECQPKNPTPSSALLTKARTLATHKHLTSPSPWRRAIQQDGTAHLRSTFTLSHGIVYPSSSSSAVVGIHQADSAPSGFLRSVIDTRGCGTRGSRHRRQRGGLWLRRRRQ